MGSRDLGWSEFTIGELLQAGSIELHKDGNYGALYPRVQDFGNEGVPFLTAKLVDDAGRINIDGAPRLSTEKASRLRFGFVKANDVLLSHNATIGRVAVVPEFEGPLLIGTSLTSFRLNSSVLLPEYLAAFFRGRYFQDQLSAVMGLSTRSQVPITTQRSLHVIVPPVKTQAAIASTLRCFDDQIDNLHQTNAILESIAQALFKSWFVDFDPVRAKAEGREPEGMGAATAALFPDEFEDSELGLIPKDWCPVAFGDVAQQGKGSINPLANPEQRFHHYSLPAFDAGQLPTVELGGEIKSNKTPVPSGAVLVSKLNPHIPRIWFVGDADMHAVCSTEFLVWTPRAGYGSAFVYCLAASPAFNAVMRQLVTGTSNSHQRVRPNQLAEVQAAVVCSETLAAFESLAAPMFQQIEHNRRRAASLAEIRDTLLPRLISGKLRLPETESMHKEATA